MRLWSLHPRYLDTKGLLAVWRESLLARAVLRGDTRGYRSHPQLARFKGEVDPLQAIDYYLEFICKEAINRGYRFDAGKFTAGLQPPRIAVTEGQIVFEKEHLMEKLLKRDPARVNLLLNDQEVDLHPLFVLVPGPKENWEKGDRPAA